MLLVSTLSWAHEEPVVNVFAWTNYFPKAVIHQFEAETGIKVNLSEYDSNEDLYAKLKADPHSGYDVIIPSSYYVQRMRLEGMLHRLDKAALTNAHFLDPALLNKAFDPHNKYSLPYLWGTTGIVVDKRYWNPKTIQRWSDLWQKRFANQLLLYDDQREVFAIGLLVLGHSINTSNPRYIKQAYLKLQKIMPNVRLFSSDAPISAYADTDVSVGMAESGDFVLARRANPYLVYIYPKDGFAVWEDCFAVPKYAPHVANAMRFINFTMRPKVGVEIAVIQGYSSPNLKTRQLSPKKDRDDPAMYPSKKTLERGHMEGYVKSARGLYLHYWQLLKLS